MFFTEIKTTIFFQMNRDLQLYIEEKLQKEVSDNTAFKWQSVSGGSINNAYKISSKEQSFFIKTNTTSIFKKGFLEEVEGLLFLAKNGLKTPLIIASEIFENNAFLILEWIDSIPKTTFFWQDLAQQLAYLHSHKNNQFGFKKSNFMGTLPQKNIFFNDFPTFFVQNRLQPQVKTAFQKQLLNKRHLLCFEKLYKELPHLIPNEKAAAVHGDLWSGNFISTHHKKGVFIDPAAYYGHREVDIAMSHLFGGFSSVFYNTYQDLYPLEKGFEKRKNIYNLYPLLVHLNLFGNSYLYDIERFIFKYN